MPEEQVKRKRGRPPKDKTETIAEINTKDIPANEFNSYSDKSSYSSFYYSICSTIFDLYTPDQVGKLVKDPITFNEELRKISRILYSCDGTLTNTIDYTTAMPTLDRIIVPYGKNKSKKSKNVEIVNSTLRTINDKAFIRDALHEGMIDGTVFYYFETSEMPKLSSGFSDYEVDCIVELNDVGMNASIIPLPVDYCRIVGIKNGRYVGAFNLDYFTDYEGESLEKKLKKFPKEIREAFHNKEKNKTSKNWVTLDNRCTIIHKIRSGKREKWGRPLVLAAIKDILYSDYFTDTKRNVLDEINNRVVYETFPEGKDKGSCALTVKQQEAQHNAVKSAVMNKNSRGGTSFFSVAAGTKLNTLDPANTDIFDSKNEENLNDTIALDLGIAASLLNGSGSGNYSSQQSNIELISAQLFQWIEELQAELNKCINYNIIKDPSNRAEVYYLPITHVNKKTMVNFAKELYLQGKGSLALWASACGIPSDAFFALLDRELEMDVENKYPVHQTSYTISSDSSDKTKPTNDNPTNQSTIYSKSSGGNNLKRPSTNK